MAISKSALKTILQSLDPKDATLWTDDGSPVLTEVQRIAKDASITRDQINEALPGLIRGQAPANSPKAIAAAAAAKQVALAQAVEPELTEETVREILARRITDAEAALNKARQDSSDAIRAVNHAEQRLQRAIADKNRKFPPVSESANIKDHLASQIELARQRAGISQVDLAMSRHGRRGEGRPTRPVNNVA